MMPVLGYWSKEKYIQNLTVTLEEIELDYEPFLVCINEFYRIVYYYIRSLLFTTQHTKSAKA